VKGFAGGDELVGTSGLGTAHGVFDGGDGNDFMKNLTGMGTRDVETAVP
jgi:hypothetical protein